MGVEHDGPPSSGLDGERRFRLDVAVAEMYTELRVNPLLRRLLTHTRALLQTAAGSFSLVDAAHGRYAKLAENGVSCQLGRSFPLDEGATGEAFVRRRPVVIDQYSDLRAGHLPRGHSASRGAAAAVPLWWRGEVIGVNVAFAGRRRSFGTDELDRFELLTQSAAAAIVHAGASDPSLARLISERRGVAPHRVPVPMVVTEVGVVRPVSAAVASAAIDVVALAQRAASDREPSGRLRVALVYRPEGLRLLIQDETDDASRPALADPLGMGARSWHELLSLAGGAADVERVAGWGTLLRADIPYARERRVAPPPAAPSPLTSREDEVLRLLAGGLSDREMAAQLVVSPKTIEKHVGAVLRKTGAPSRAAAVMRALERGWLAAETPGFDERR